MIDEIMHSSDPNTDMPEGEEEEMEEGMEEGKEEGGEGEEAGM